ncbi:alpha/beta hydrolase-fold protein [Streptomyces inhibens]|uniref:alpha/beta hydrolase-fold protein n=1 Tax=Streptomyces inhibens TaxID=2293571 RepID=UPI0037A1503A
MRPVLSRARAAVATLAAALLILGMPAAHAAPPDAPPKPTDGFGLTQVGTANGTGGGISMGGFGSLHHARAHPELFSQVAALSGAVDLSLDEAVIRAAVVATLTNTGAPFCGAVAGAGQRPDEKRKTREDFTT